MTPEEVRTLYTYNRWANHRLLDACRPLDSTAFTRDLGNSFPSIRDTFAHVLGGEWIWLERWQHRSPKKFPPPADFPDVDAIERRWSEIEREQQRFLNGLTDDLLRQRIAYENLKNERWEYSLAQMLQHVVNHSTYHRGQVTTMLRQLGAAAVSTDLLLYVDETTS